MYIMYKGQIYLALYQIFQDALFVGGVTVEGRAGRDFDISCAYLDSLRINGTKEFLAILDGTDAAKI